MSGNSTTKAAIRKFLSKVFGDHQVGDGDDIFAQGFVNSLFAMELVLFVEREFSITIGNEDLEIDNFRTINALAALVGRKTGGH